MSAKENCRALMNEVAPLIDALMVTEYESEGTWALQVDEAILLIVDLDEEDGRLVVSADAGRIQEGRQGEIHERLLRYNYCWRETGGVRMALDGPGGEVVQMADVPLAGLDVVRWHRILASFIDMLRAWREILAGEALPPDKALPGDDVGDMIRA